MSVTTALTHLRSRCAAGEVCLADVRNYFRRHPELTADECQQIIDSLLADHYIDEARYARAFVSDKLRFNRWGRQRLRQELRLKGIGDDDIKAALATIDDDEYRQTLRQLLDAKRRTLRGADDRETRAKLARHAAAHGFELSLIFNLLGDDD